MDNDFKKFLDDTEQLCRRILDATPNAEGVTRWPSESQREDYKTLEDEVGAVGVLRLVERVRELEAQAERDKRALRNAFAWLEGGHYLENIQRAYEVLKEALS